MASSITVSNFDNKPFFRTATVQANGISPTDIIRWSFPSYVTAKTATLSTYTSNTPAQAFGIGTLTLSFSGTRYNFQTENYTLCTLQLSCFGPSSAATSNIIFDTFPDIDLTLYINYERTNSSSYFFRLTSTDPLVPNPRLAPYFINLTSTAYNLTSSLSANYFKTWYSVNNEPTQLTNLTALTGFNRTEVNTVSSVQATLSATSAPGSLTPFWTSHILERSLSAKFVPYFLSGDFIGYPKGYFSSKNVFDLLNVNDLQNTPGLRFYGEGHTETINLSSRIIDDRATTFIWRLDNSITKYPVSSILPSQPLTSVYVTLPTQKGSYPTIPVSLHVTNNLFLSTDPFYYYDDSTGEVTPYPYYISTIDFNSNEIVPRNKLKESIKIQPYSSINYNFIPGIDNVIHLPLNQSQVNYNSVFNVALYNPFSLEPCYGKYGLVWNWLSFFNCADNPDTFTGKPSSWMTVGSASSFPKFWEKEPPTSSDLFLTDSVMHSAISLGWILSTEQTKHVEYKTPLESNSFNFSLALKDKGGASYLGANNRKGITLSEFNITSVLLSALYTTQSVITATITPNAQAQGYTNDWQIKQNNIDINYNILSVPLTQLSIYTPNRFVLTGTEVKFENLFTETNMLTSVIIDLDDNKTLLLTGADIDNDFSAVYNTVGYKTIRITLNSPFRSISDVFEFPNIVRVFSEYDEVYSNEYRSTITPLVLPWPNKPQVGSNDWIVEDNINNWFKKFFDNLNYLESRARTYQSGYSDYFGHLGPQPTITEDLTSCGIWTWEDLDCFNTALPETVTWRDVLSSEDTLTPSGKYVNEGCATWQTYECKYDKVSPTCYGLHDVEWSWKIRKKGNSLVPITWKQTKCSDKYPKTWLYQPPILEPVLVCNESKWHVNIPRLDTYYKLPDNTSVQTRCINYGITSKKNILYIARKNQLRLFNSDRNATFFDYEDTADEVIGFSNIKNVCLDSNEKIYILDNLLSRVSVYTYENDTLGRNFKLFTTWGGFGSFSSTSKFSNPNDIHVDQLDNVWVTDTGNGCVKHYSNTGSWIKTIIDDSLKKEIPLSTAIDSQKNVHILTKESIRVYSYTGEFLFVYFYKQLTQNEPRRITSSYNREVIYFATEFEVLKYFRNGVFYSFIIDKANNITNITGLFHDEYRNLLVTSNDRVFKFSDVMTIKQFKAALPDNYWKIEDVLIHKKEYVQDWVYTKSFQRMWDNIEIFRSTLFYNDTNCKEYKPPIHSKEKMFIGQNEIVTSTVINRVLGYLWDNLSTMFDYFNPSCE